MIAFASSLDQGGPIARTAEDCAILLNAMASFDRRDSTSLKLPEKDYRDEINRSISGAIALSALRPKEPPRPLRTRPPFITLLNSPACQA